MYDNEAKLKEIEVCILNEFIAVCQRYDLRYYVIGGTLLGTVRHKGFIPWDDDIDVAMPRKDYEKFEKIAPKSLPRHLFFQTRKSDPEYFYSFGKIRNSNTTFIETACRNKRINQGIYIDVFPLDYYPENRIKQTLIDFMNLMFRFRFKKEIAISSYKKSSVLGRIIDSVGSNTMMVFMPTVSLAYELRKKMHTKCQNSLLWANYGGAWGRKEIVPISWYGKGKKMKFENTAVIVPDRYDLWLKRVYGDYMKLPPVEKRVTHHYADIIDVNHSYKYYIHNKVNH